MSKILYIEATDMKLLQVCTYFIFLASYNNYLYSSWKFWYDYISFRMSHMIKTTVRIVVKNLKCLKMFSLINVCSSGGAGLLVG